ncbi:TonB-dependent receptor [bacterium]|nr:TonB-dependent receptor [bacterium]
MLFLSFSLLLAAENGRINGTVRSVSTAEALPGTNILLKGTLMGAASDLGGEFRILNVPPGDYTLEVLNIGYQSIERQIHLRPDSVVTLDIRLEPKALRSPEIVVTGARRTMRKIDSPVTIVTISAEDLAFRNPATVEDILPYESGVQMLDGQVSMRGSSGYARGAGSRVVVLVDGFPAMSFDNGTIYWDAVPAQNIERIEILKGPGSALYGSSAMGGVINIITKTLNPGKQTNVSFGGGIYRKPTEELRVWSDRPMLMEEWRAAHSRSFGDLGVALAVGRHSSTGYHENGWYDRGIFNTEFDYAIGQNRLIRSRVYLILDKHGSFTEWKSPFQPFHTPPNTIDDEITTHKLQWSTQYSRICSPAQSRLMRLNVFDTRFDSDLYNNTTYSQSRTVNPEFQINLRPGRRHYISSGLDLKLHRVNADIWGNHKGLEAAAYFQDEVTLAGFLNVTLGARWDLNRVDDNACKYQLNPKIGTTLDITKHLVLRSSLGRAYRSPSMAEMFIDAGQYIFVVKPNPDLQPETSLAAEIGLYWQSRIFNLDMALFSSNYRDLIEPILDPLDQEIQFRNVTEARIQGFEVTADWYWQLISATGKISYTYIDPRDLTADDVLAYRHRHSLVISEQLALSRNMIVGLDYRYLSRMEKVQLYNENPLTGADQRVPVKLLSGFFQYSLDNSLTLNLSVENMLQYYYVVFERNMGPVRLLKLRVEYRF